MEKWIEACASELCDLPDGTRHGFWAVEAIIDKHHAPCALSARCAAERVQELTAAARYLMVALHSAAAADSRADVLAIARDAAEKWPELAPGSPIPRTDVPTTPPRRS